MKKPLLSKLFLGAAVLSLSFLTSCKDEEKSTPSNSNTPTSATTNSAATNEKATAQLNPEHGLPGHRCDLPVGAPLSGTNPSQTIQSTNNPAPSSNVSPIRVDQTPSVNPPHGEPGHDCAIPVGAPLK